MSKENHAVATRWKQFVLVLTDFSPDPLKFKPGNEALDASLKDLAQQGLISSTKHTRPISKEDLEALYAANQPGLDTPESLINTARLYTVLCFG